MRSAPPFLGQNLGSALAHECTSLVYEKHENLEAKTRCFKKLLPRVNDFLPSNTTLHLQVKYTKYCT